MDLYPECSYILLVICIPEGFGPIHVNTEAHGTADLYHDSISQGFPDSCGGHLASYPGSSTEKRGGSLEDFITCLVT